MNIMHKFPKNAIDINCISYLYCITIHWSRIGRRNGRGRLLHCRTVGQSLGGTWRRSTCHCLMTHGWHHTTIFLLQCWGCHLSSTTSLQRCCRLGWSWGIFGNDAVFSIVIDFLLFFFLFWTLWLFIRQWCRRWSRRHGQWLTWGVLTIIGRSKSKKLLLSLSGIEVLRIRKSKFYLYSKKLFTKA